MLPSPVDIATADLSNRRQENSLPPTEENAMPGEAGALAANAAGRVAALVRRRGAAGAQYLVVREGCTELEVCHGMADALRQRTVTPETTFNVYSITKVFTAAAVLGLVESGRLGLDAPIGTAVRVAGLEAYGTVRDTLLHRAGFRNPNPLRWIHPAEQHHRFDEAGFVRAQTDALRGSRRRRARSGYSNIGYLLLGQAIERAWNGQFVDAVQALVIDPLQARQGEQLSFSIDPVRHAPGHLRRHGLVDWLLGLLIDRPTIVEGGDKRWVRLRLHHVNGSAYGGLMANARGLSRFGHAVLGYAPGVVPAVRRELLTVVPGPGPLRSLGWFCGRSGGELWFGHAGGGLGAYSELRVYPAIGAVSVLMTNGPGFSDARCLDELDGPWLPGR
jgi:CubicO group peptidase (beta-lactamase class C family)